MMNGSSTSSHTHERRRPTMRTVAARVHAQRRMGEDWGRLGIRHESQEVCGGYNVHVHANMSMCMFCFSLVDRYIVR